MARAAADEWNSNHILNDYLMSLTKMKKKLRSFHPKIFVFQFCGYK
jgi:hypothetical protein